MELFLVKILKFLLFDLRQKKKKKLRDQFTSSPILVEVLWGVFMHRNLCIILRFVYRRLKRCLISNIWTFCVLSMLPHYKIQLLIRILLLFKAGLIIIFLYCLFICIRVHAGFTKTGVSDLIYYLSGLASEVRLIFYCFCFSRDWFYTFMMSRAIIFRRF